MAAAHLRSPVPVAARSDSFDGCSARTGYPEARIARAVASKLQARLDAYRCQHCHQWHIGKPPVSPSDR